jgi:L-lactate dehydrogenase complex protein LldG
MDSRTKILSALTGRKGEGHLQLATISISPIAVKEKFNEMLTSIGGAVIEVESLAGVLEYIHQHYGDSMRVVSLVGDNTALAAAPPRTYDDVEVTVMYGHFGVAENGAVWITDELLPDRVLPFISQHLIVVLRATDIVATMHDAYERIGNAEYEFATFIAGPSKTADIEQSLVLGAHGPKSMTVFLLTR